MITITVSRSKVKKMEKKQEKKSVENKSGADDQRQEDKKGKLEGLPIEDSPYLQYKDLEDYKRQGYGTEGHQQPNPGRGAGATDAPTLSGGAVCSEAEATTIDTINRLSIP